MFRLVVILLICCMMSAGSAWEAEMKDTSTGGIVTYPVPDAVTDSPYIVTVDGKPVPIEKAGAYNGAYYTRFELKGKVRAEVKVKATAATLIELKPERFRTNLESISSGVRFDVEKPGPRVLTVTCGSKEIWPLIILAEEARSWPEPSAGRKMIHAKDYVKGDGIQTADLQKALDDGSRTGVMVYFEPGVYRTGALRIGSNTEVFLAPGCLILGSTDPKDYNTQLGQKELGSNSPGFSSNGLINFINCKDSAIRGPGVIEGMGHILRNELGHSGRDLKIVSSENIVVEDVILRNSPAWTCQVFGSKNVTLNNVKVLADWSVGNTDGINPDCSQDVTISNYFGFCGDDAVAVKATTASELVQGSQNIRVMDSIVMTRKTAFKIGTETRKDISDVAFERCEAINSSRGIGIYLYDGKTVSNVTYRDMKFDLKEYPGESASGELFTLAIGDRSGIGRMKGLIFERVSASVPYGSGISGKPESKIEDVTFKGCSMEIRNRWMKLGKSPVLDLTCCKAFRFTGFRLHWDTVLDGLWDGFMKQTDCEDIAVEGFEETRTSR